LNQSKVVYSISPHYKGNDESHVYWFEKALGEAARAQGYRYESITGYQDGSDYVRKALYHSSAQRHKLLFTPWAGLIRDVLSIRRAVKNETDQITWHVYDGGFREFLLITLLLMTYKESTAVFNFTTLEPWVAIIGSTKAANSGTRKAVSRLKKVFGSRLTLFADSKELGVELSPGANFISDEYPLFTFMAGPESGHGILGDTNQVLFSPCNETELQLSLDAIGNLKNQNKVSILPVIQLRWGGKVSDSRVAEIERKGIRLHQESLSAKDYAKLYSNTRVAVMPYLDRKYYKFQSSGRLLDSVSRGCVVVVPDKTVLGRKAIENSWGFTFSSDSSLSLANAIEKALNSKLESNAKPPTAKAAAEILFGGSAFVHPRAKGALPILSLFIVATSPLFELGPGFILGSYRYARVAFRKLFKI
jgi:glycosyltransferase involved in cell wall biosynthesis